MAKAKEKAGLRLTIEGSKLEVGVLFAVEGGRASSLAKSDAGGAGFSFRNCCRTHKQALNMPRTCAACRQTEAEAIVRLLRVRDSVESLTLRIEALSTMPKLVDRQAEAGQIVDLIGPDILPEVAQRVRDLAELSKADARVAEAASIGGLLRESVGPAEVEGRLANLGSVQSIAAEQILKGHEVGEGAWAFLEPAQVEELKPKGDDSVHIIEIVPEEEVGPGFHGPVVRLLGNVRCLVPNTTSAQPTISKAMAERYACLVGLLQGHVAVARVMHKGNFRYALLRVGPTNALLCWDLYLPEDTYDVPQVSLPVIKQEVLDAFRAKGQALAGGGRFSLQLVAEDPYRDARAEAIARSLRGETAPVDAPVPIAAKPAENLLALV